VWTHGSQPFAGLAGPRLTTRTSRHSVGPPVASTVAVLATPRNQPWPQLLRTCRPPKPCAVSLGSVALVVPRSTAKLVSWVCPLAPTRTGLPAPTAACGYAPALCDATQLAAGGFVEGVGCCVCGCLCACACARARARASASAAACVRVRLRACVRVCRWVFAFAFAPTVAMIPPGRAVLFSCRRACHMCSRSGLGLGRRCV
jgi:hypothetical protein